MKLINDSHRKKNEKFSVQKNYPIALSLRIDHSKLRTTEKKYSQNLTRNINDALFSSDLRSNVQTFNLYDSTRDQPLQYKIPLKSWKVYNPLIDKEEVITRPDMLIESKLTNYNNQYNRLVSHTRMFNKKIGYFTQAHQHLNNNVLAERLRDGSNYI